MRDIVKYLTEVDMKGAKLFWGFEKRTETTTETVEFSTLPRSCQDYIVVL